MAYIRSGILSGFSKVGFVENYGHSVSSDEATSFSWKNEYS